MPTKILTDQPQYKRITVRQAIATPNFADVLEPPYFSVPLENEDVAVVDPDDDDRELRGGEAFIATAIVITNGTSAARTVEVRIAPEGGGTEIPFGPGRIVVPAYDSYNLPPGISLFKRNLSAPANAGDVLQMKSNGSSMFVTFTYVQREPLEHDPDTENV